MFTVPNLFTFTRIPLALIFVDGSALGRGLTVLLAALTDFLDGYWARRFRAGSQLGKVFDPLVDKFFVLCCASALARERVFDEFQITALFLRDLSLIAFMGYALFAGIWRRCSIQPAWWGKVFTALQFAVLFAYCLFGSISHAAFWPFVALGPLFFFELWSRPLLPKIAKRGKSL